MRIVDMVEAAVTALAAALDIATAVHRIRQARVNGAAGRVGPRVDPPARAQAPASQSAGYRRMISEGGELG